MENEIIKTLEKKNANTTKTLKKIGHIFLLIVLFPVCIIDRVAGLIQNYIYTNTEWNEEKTKKILDYFLVKKGKYNKEKKELVLIGNWFLWNKRNVKFQDRIYWKKYLFDIVEYLRNGYELEGFDKTIYDLDRMDWTEVVFSLKD